MRYVEMMRWLVLALVGGALGTAHAVFPGDNGIIVYVDSGSGNIKKVQPGGGAPITLARGDSPMVSPNGRKIVYSAPTATTFDHVFVMNLDGSNVVDIGQGTGPAWSDDGAKIALFDKGLYVVNAADGSQRTLITGDLAINRINWLAGALVYSKYVVASNAYDSFQINADGSFGPPRLYRPAAMTPLKQPSWYPTERAAIATDSVSRCLHKTNEDSAVQVLSICNQDYPSVSPDGSSILSTTLTGSYDLVAWPLSGAASQTVAQYGLRADWGRRPRSTMVSTLANGQWSAPAVLAGDTDVYTAASAVTVMPDAGLIGQTLQQVMSVGSDRRVYHRVQRMDGSWTPYALVAGVRGSSAGLYAKRVAIAGAKDGSVQVLVVGMDDDVVYHAMRYADGTWSGFTALNGYSGSANFAARDVAIAIGGSSSSSPGTAQVVASGLAGGAVFHRARLPDGSWTPFALPPGSPTNMDQVAIATALNGDAYVLAAGPSTGIVRQLRLADGSWDAWVNMANVPTALKDVSLTIGRNSYGQHVAKVAYVASNGSVQYQQREDAQRQSAWTNPTIQPANLVSEGRSVSISNTDTGAALVVAQAQAQQ